MAINQKTFFMKKLNYVLFLSFVFLLIAGCSKLDTQPELLNSNDNVTLKKKDKDHYVPFKATFEVNVSKIYPPPTPPRPPKIQEVLGTGNVTHLGKTNLYIKQWWWPNSPPPFTLPRWGHGNGELIFTAANGDILLATYDDAISHHKSKTDVYVTFTGHFKDGGTGRFEHAEGSFEWIVIFNPTENIGTATATGKIMY